MTAMRFTICRHDGDEIRMTTLMMMMTRKRLMMMIMLLLMMMMVVMMMLILILMLMMMKMITIPTVMMVIMMLPPVFPALAVEDHTSTPKRDAGGYSEAPLALPLATALALAHLDKGRLRHSRHELPEQDPHTGARPGVCPNRASPRGYHRPLQRQETDGDLHLRDTRPTKTHSV